MIEKMISKAPSQRSSASSLAAGFEMNAEKSERRLLKEHIDMLEAKNSELEAELRELRMKIAKTQVEKWSPTKPHPS